MLPVEYIAQNLKKYAFIDNDKARIELLIPFELWNEIVNEAIEMEKINILANQANENHWKKCLNYEISENEIIKEAQKHADKTNTALTSNWIDRNNGFIIGANWYKEKIKM